MYIQIFIRGKGEEKKLEISDFPSEIASYNDSACCEKSAEMIKPHSGCHCCIQKCLNQTYYAVFLILMLTCKS